MGRHYAHRHHYHHRHLARGSRWERGVAQMQARGFADTNASIATSSASGSIATSGGFASSNVVAEARRWSHPAGRARDVAEATIHAAVTALDHGVVTPGTPLADTIRARATKLLTR